MGIVFFDNKSIWDNLLPLSFTRPISEFRVGILKIREKWEMYLGASNSYYLTEGYLQEKYALGDGHSIFIDSATLPSTPLVEAIKNLREGTFLMRGSDIIAFNGSLADLACLRENKPAAGYKLANYEGEIARITYPWHIFKHNGAEIRNDFKLITKGRQSVGPDDPYTRVYSPENVFIEEGADIKAAVINAENGPVYIGKGASIQEGALIKGPFALLEHSVVNMGAKVRGDTTVGPYSKIGGEVSNSVIFGYSNKGHDGFLGNSVLGEWCNLGADTNNSNLKNNYKPVKIWNYPEKRFINTGEQFCGLIMGDHSKCGINTMFNTGTVVGVGANIFGSGFPRNFIPSFAWGGANGFSTFVLPQFFQTVKIVMDRRGIELDGPDKEILKHIFEQGKEFRNWENN